MHKNLRYPEVLLALFLLIVGGMYFFSAQTPAAPANTTSNEENDQVQQARSVAISASIDLPLTGSAPTTDVAHTIMIDEIRRGCFTQDCIPSIDNPSFIAVETAVDLLASDSIGIALSYQGVDRFYPFPMLETHELVNNVVAGEPLLISYCPLCGTGIVFSREIDGTVAEFGVSGMLWQSNLLMYNRAENLAERNLWSQVLGEAVVGERAGEKLRIIPSDIMQFTAWAEQFPKGEVLAGEPRDPYQGRYYEVAAQFKPDFELKNSPLPPMSYVYGIEYNGRVKAYPRAQLPVGITTDTVADATLTIERTGDLVTFSDETGSIIADVEGFWFSWQAAHPDTLLWKPAN